MGYFQVRYNIRVIIYDHTAFTILSTVKEEINGTVITLTKKGVISGLPASGFALASRE